AAKIVNMRGVARRKATLRGREQIATLGHYLRQAREARDRASLMGIEGAATARYFATWPDLLSDRAGDLEWQGRSRRPPRDIINAMLSYAYALVAGECLCAAAAAGLDPRAGFLHAARAGRPALAIDMMEPFRPLIADQAVLAGVNNGQVRPDLVEETEGGPRFTEDGRRLTLDLVERRLSIPITLPDRSEPISYRAAIGVQALALATALRDGSPFAAMERA
ncbi:MAG: CRISPR-associated endonuclease Cas1, partial [Vicinamibacterales bacterium]